MIFLNYLNHFLSWQKRFISEKSFIIILSVIVGIIAGLAAILLKKTVHLLQNLTFDNPLINTYFYLFPFVGILLAVFLSKLLYREKIGHAITDILFAILKKSAKMSKNKMYSRFLTSLVTVGMGGSSGLEAPIVLTGSAIGSNIGKALLLNYKNRVLLIGCGSAAVISAIFNAPIAGLIFSIEVILFDITISSFIPLLVSSVTATLTSILLYEDDALFGFKQITQFELNDLPFYLLLGIFCALVANGFNQSSLLIDNLFKKIKSASTRYLIGASILGISISIFPSLYGEGYKTISSLLVNQTKILFEKSILVDSIADNHWNFVAFLILLIVVKYISFACTLGAGGAGGTFAPSLFLGCISGFAFAKAVNLIYGPTVSESTFALVGMCGVLSATQYAPLTAIFLIAELTGGYTLFVPLMIVSAISYSTVSYFYPDSPYLRHLIAQGEYIKGSKDTKILSKLDAEKLIETDFITINKDCFLKDLVEVVKKSKRNLYPVIDGKSNLVGYITLDDVREKMFEKKLYSKIVVSSLMAEVPATIELGEKMTKIIEKFETTQSWNLPVIDEQRYVGFISKSRIFNYYRDELIKEE